MTDLFGSDGPCERLSATSCSTKRGWFCRCKLIEKHDGLCRCRYCAFTFLPTPPTGPLSDGFTEAESAPRAYIEWRQTDEGRRALSWMVARATEQVEQGEARVSINWLSDEMRRLLKVRHTNTWRPWMADDLVALFPHLIKVIERKTRKKKGPEPIR